MKLVLKFAFLIAVTGFTAASDETWYEAVFGSSILPEVSGGNLNTYDGWSSEKKTHHASVSSSASVTIGCEGIQFDSAFSSQFDNLFADIETSMKKPVMILIAAASYFIGSAYEVVNDISGEITETISGLIGSCENSGKALADFAADKIPELGKYYCDGQNGGNDRNCLPEELEKSVNDFLRKWGQDVVDKVAEKINDKTRPAANIEKWYILGEQDISFCERRQTNPSYLHAVYASTSMTCFEMHAAHKLLGNVTIVTEGLEAKTSQIGDQYEKQIVNPTAPSKSLEHYFLEMSQAYGSALFEIASSDNPESTAGYQQWNRSPYTDSTTGQFLNLITMLHVDNKQGRLANVIRLKADMAAENHIAIELSRISSYLSEYDSADEPSKIVLENNPLSNKLKSVLEQMEAIKDLRGKRREEIELMNELLRQEG